MVPILRSCSCRARTSRAQSCTNELIIVDTFANVRRIEAIVASMDKGDALELPKCAIREPGPPRATSPPLPAPAPAQPATLSLLESILLELEGLSGSDFSRLPDNRLGDRTCATLYGWAQDMLRQPLFDR